MTNDSVIKVKSMEKSSQLLFLGSFDQSVHLFAHIYAGILCYVYHHAM